MSNYSKLNVEAVLIGEKKISHIINVSPVILEKESAKEVGHQFLQKQYPGRFKDMVDISVSACNG